MLYLIQTSKLPLGKFFGAFPNTIYPSQHWITWQTTCLSISMRKRNQVLQADRGSVWIVDLGMATDPQDRVLVTIFFTHNERLSHSL
jgi:hypothetical protein